MAIMPKDDVFLLTGPTESVPARARSIEGKPLVARKYATGVGVHMVTKPLQPRASNDFYSSPPELVAAVVDRLIATPTGYLTGNGLRVLDPGAGDGVWGRELKKRLPDAWVEGVEIRQDQPRPAADYQVYRYADYLDPANGIKPHSYSIVLGNPPYSLAEEFVRRARVDVAGDGQILFLLPLAFLASQGRARGLWAEFPPTCVYVCSDRPSFTNNGKTDAREYAIFQWLLGIVRPGRLPQLDFFLWRERGPRKSVRQNNKAILGKGAEK